MSNCPFYYQVKFHLLARNEENDLIFQDWSKDFDDPNPLKARQEAFEAFEDYLNYLVLSNKAIKDDRGNYKIISPSGIPPEPDFTDEEDLETISIKLSNYFEYREDLDVLIVMKEDELAEEIGHGDYVLPIHTVSSRDVNAQQLIGNLELVELELYRRCGKDVEQKVISVEHYGEDYEESGEKEEAAHWTILPTPFVWQTEEEYLKIIGEGEKDRTLETEEEAKSEPKEGYSFLWEKAIANGESKKLEFKPSLVYNFENKTSNWKPLFNNARTICGFLNAEGGILLIGVSDDGQIQGIEHDLQLLKNKDKIRLEVDNMIASFFGNSISALINVSFEVVNKREILVIKVQPSQSYIFLKKYNPVSHNTSKHFYVRRNASTTEIKDVEDIVDYILNKWPRK